MMYFGKFSKAASHVSTIFILSGLFFLLLASPAFAIRSLEWRDGNLWIIPDPSLNEEAILFQPYIDNPPDEWMNPVAVMSPDFGWVVYSRHTGGGYENEGQSCFVSRWNGADEKLLLETTRIIENGWWLECQGEFYVAIQLSTGGTIYRSFFQIVGLESGEVEATIEGRIYGASYWGARYQPQQFYSAVGLRYEVLSFDEEPYRWGIFYVDELTKYAPADGILDIDGTPVSECELTDGDVRTAWIADSTCQPGFTINYDSDFNGRALLIQSGYQWHEPPPGEGLPWEGTDMWPLYDRPKTILLTFSDGRDMEIELVDTRCIQIFSIPEEYPLGHIKVTIQSVYWGTETHCGEGEGG
ncbi:MAG: hypothetical protein NTY09_11850 [bacterium]|nr:hypothetical protein [bacterium]